MDFEPTAVVTAIIAGVNAVGAVLIKPIFTRLKDAETKLADLPKDYVLKVDHATMYGQILEMLREVRDDVKGLRNVPR